MKFQLLQLRLQARQSMEIVEFSPTVSFFHGPVSTGKSTIARLIDFCLGGDLERTPAIQQEFVSAELLANVGLNRVQFERGSHDGSAVRVTWTGADGELGSVSAPLAAAEEAIYADDVYNFSDLVFWLAGVSPIKVRRSKLDPDSPLVRLSFRDLMPLCYLQQDHLDSSFFRLEDPFKRLKTQDAMRFVTGLHSERMNELDILLVRAINEQRSKREAVAQIRAFMGRFEMGTEFDLINQQREVSEALTEATRRRTVLETERATATHIVEPMRQSLRVLSDRIDEIRTASQDLLSKLSQRESLRAELISAKVKSARVEAAGEVLSGSEFTQCPRCGCGIANRTHTPGTCCLCLNPEGGRSATPAIETEVLRRDLNERIDELSDAIARQRRERDRQERLLQRTLEEKKQLDTLLTTELAKYDTAFVASIRAADREVATLQERLASFDKLRALPQAIADLELEAGRLQGDIDQHRTALAEERGRLHAADTRVKRIAEEFFGIMRQVRFPGVFEDDTLVLDPRNWQPLVKHGDQTWSFYDAGSGGKKTLFNVCYAIAVHRVAAEEDLPLPGFLIIDSPTKNISADENPELVKALYSEIYALAGRGGRSLQFVLIDSDLFEPPVGLEDFSHRRMAGETDAPRLIPYYEGP